MTALFVIALLHIYGIIGYIFYRWSYELVGEDTVIVSALWPISLPLVLVTSYLLLVYKGLKRVESFLAGRKNRRQLPEAKVVDR